MRRIGTVALFMGIILIAVSHNSYQAFSSLTPLPYLIVTIFPSISGYFYLLLCSTLASSMNTSLITFQILFYLGLASVASGLTLLVGKGLVAGILAFPILLYGFPVPQIYQAVTRSFPYSFLIFDTVGMSNLYILISPRTYYTLRVYFCTAFFLYYMCFLDLFYRHMLLSTLYYFNIVLPVGAALTLIIVGATARKKLGGAHSQLISLLKSSEAIKLSEAEAFWLECEGG